MTSTVAGSVNEGAAPHRFLPALCAIANVEFAKLCAEFPAQEALGGLVFLGRHYATERPGILMLGINPGASKYNSFSCQLHERNFLMPGGDDLGIRYWRNAHFFFNANDTLRAAMETSTFSFCCPYRTPRWNGLPQDLMRALMRHSRPVLTRLIDDCMPHTIIVAGVAGLNALRDIASGELQLGPVISPGRSGGGTYQWQAVSATFRERTLTIAQIPHLSRANSTPRLGECANWLASIVASPKRNDPS